MHLCLDSQDYRKSLITRTMATMEVYEVVRDKIHGGLTCSMNMLCLGGSGNEWR